MTPIDWIFGSLLLAAIVGIAKLHSSNIRLENDKQKLTEQVGELAGKIADLSQDNTEAIKCLTSNSEAEMKKKDKEMESLHKELDLMRQQQAPKDHVDRKAVDMLVRIAEKQQGVLLAKLFRDFFGDATPKGEHFFAQLVKAELVEQKGVDGTGAALWVATQKGKDLAFGRPS